MSTPASVVLGATAGGGSIAGPAAPILAVTGVQLPATGSGGGPAISSSMVFLMAMSAASAVVSAGLFLVGKRHQYEDDGIHESR